MLALNAAHERETSALGAAALGRLIAMAFHVGLADDGRAGFVLAFDQDADYGSANFLWFRRRYARFVYVDRIIVGAPARGRGIARTLYEALFVAARAAWHAMVGCEVNIAPPNPGSLAFHTALGFAAVGEGAVGGGKLVRYLARPIG